MREVKFRGKYIDYKGDLAKTEDFPDGWVYGYYCGCPHCNGTINHVEGLYGNVQVDKSTVGQYSDHRDMRDVAIYEGDLVNFNIWGKVLHCEIKWSEQFARLVALDLDDGGLVGLSLENKAIVGNIYD